MKTNQRLGGISTETVVLQALQRGPLTVKQIEQRSSLSNTGARCALKVLVVTGQVVEESYEGSTKRKQYRAVRP